MVTVRRACSPQDISQAVAVQASAWGSRDYRDVAPAHVLKALCDNGGIVLGAFEGDRLIGVSYGWMVADKGYFYSHATGVSSGSKYKGVGYMLKLKQREEVLSRGVNLIKWTFDPLQSLNSYFNLEKLGVIARSYVVNYYGEMEDDINRGLGSDRVIAEWWLDSKRVELSIKGKGRTPEAERLLELGGEIALDYDGPGGIQPSQPRIDLDSDIIMVGLPESISELRDRRFEAAVMWRKASRSVYSSYMSSGYVMVGFSRSSRSAARYNVLVKGSLESILRGELPWRKE